MKDITLLSHVQSLAAPRNAPSAAPQGGGFGEALKTAVAEVNSQQQEADRAIEEVQTGQNRNLHEAMISMEQADISLRLMVETRNKVIEAYQEIMRMQV